MEENILAYTALIKSINNKITDQDCSKSTCQHLLSIGETITRKRLLQ